MGSFQIKIDVTLPVHARATGEEAITLAAGSAAPSSAATGRGQRSRRSSTFSSSLFAGGAQSLQQAAGAAAAAASSPRVGAGPMTPTTGRHQVDQTVFASGRAFDDPRRGSTTLNPMYGGS